MTPITATRLSTAVVYPVLPAEDLGRAKTFYHDTLGFEIEDVTGGAMVHAGKGSRILLYERPRTVAEHTVAEFEVEDLHATMDELKAHGVTFEEYDLPGLKTANGIASMGDAEVAWFTDPEGNIIALSSIH